MVGPCNAQHKNNKKQNKNVSVQTYSPYHQEENKQLHYSSPVSNNFKEKPGLIGNLITCGEVQLGPLNVLR
jgi:hypothetical protein